MKRVMFAVVVLAVVSSAGVSFAQDAVQMPEKVRAFLDNMSGSWRPDGASEGMIQGKWDSANNTLIGVEQFQTKDTSETLSSLWHWDGISKDGIILSWSGSISKGFAYGELQGKVLSKTLMEGQVTGVISGVIFDANVHVEFQGPNQYTWRRTQLVVDGEKMPDESTVFTRVKTDTSKLSPAMKKLEGLVGDWVYEGEQADQPVAGLPYGGAGKYFGTYTDRFILNGSFLERRIEDNNPSGRTSIVALTGYDAKAGKYTGNAFISDGSSSVSASTVHARTLTNDSTMTTSEGKKVLVRSVSKYSSDWSNYVSTTEASPDNGKTWKLWYKEEGKKVNKNDVASSTTREDFEEFCKLAEGRWMAEITLNEDWPGFGKKGDKFTAYMHQTLVANGNAMTGELSFGKGWITELKTYDPDTKEIITNQAASDGSISYLTERKGHGEWPIESTEISADGIKTKSEGTSVFSEDGKTWTVSFGSVGTDKGGWTPSVWHRLSK